MATTVKIVSAIFGLLILIGMLVPAQKDQFEQSSTNQQTRYDQTMQAMWAACRRAVEARLVAPRTVHWPNWITEVPEVRANDALTEGAVLSHVDAQNRFGAMVRMKFVCLLRKDGQAWMVRRLEIQ